MQQLSAIITAFVMNQWTSARRRLEVSRQRAADRGEGVISAAIAVLVFAFLGTAMWLAFKGVFDGSSSKVSAQINQVGQ